MWKHNRELIVDNFAGGGGVSTGVAIALGIEPDVAINHDDKALSMHRANHPSTHHITTDVFDVDPAEVCKGRPVGLAWFSPSCTHFSKAKGGQPKDNKVRGLAWVVLNWVRCVQPRVIILENVVEFQKWCPLIREKQVQRLLTDYPKLRRQVRKKLEKSGTTLTEEEICVGSVSPWRPGWFFQCFVGALRRRGYVVDWRELNAHEYGAPTCRRRLFLVARRDGQPIVWPSPTHGGEGQPPFNITADYLNFSKPCPSIFGRKRPLAKATMQRIFRCIRRFVIEADEPYIINVDGSSAAPVMSECANASNPRGWRADEPQRTICASVKGGHHTLISASLVKHYGGGYTGPGVSAKEPSHSITTTDHHALVTTRLEPEELTISAITKFRGTNTGHDLRDPVHVISAQGTHLSEVRAFLIKYYGNEKGGHPIDQPVGTITCKDRMGLVMVKGERYQITDIGMRMLSPRELFDLQSFPRDYTITQGVDEKGETVPLTITDQVRMVGNSVPPELAAAVIKANFKPKEIETLQG